MTMPWTLEEKICHLLGESHRCFLENVKAGWGILDQPQAAGSCSRIPPNSSGVSHSSLPLPQPHMVFSLPKIHSCLSALHILPCTLALLLRVRGWGGVSLFL